MKKTREIERDGEKLKVIQGFARIPAEVEEFFFFACQRSEVISTFKIALHSSVVGD